MIAASVETEDKPGSTKLGERIIVLCIMFVSGLQTLCVKVFHLFAPTGALYVMISSFYFKCLDDLMCHTAETLDALAPFKK